MSEIEGWEEWSVEAELEGMELGDPRRNRRALQIAGKLAKAPSLSFPETSSDDSELEAQYRFFSNKHVSFDELLLPHQAATARRCNGEPIILAIHDTSKFTFSGARTDLPQCETDEHTTSAFSGHFTLAVKPGAVNLPMGILAFEPVFSKKHSNRKGRVGPKPHAHKIPRELKESARWDRGVDEAHRVLSGRADVIHVADQEADDFVWIAKLLERGRRFVVRGSHARLLKKRAESVQAVLERQHDAIFRVVKLSTRANKDYDPYAYGEREEREAVLRIRHARVRIHRTRITQSDVEHLDLNVVQVFEPAPPPGQEPVEWTLFTSEPIDTDEQRAFVVDAYRARWTIEEYFKALKTGCAYEQRQLCSATPLLNALALLLPIAWRLLALKAFARLEQTSAPRSATLPSVLSRAQLLLLRNMSKRVHLSAQPTSADIIRAIAGIGGHLRRNGEPGWLTIWRGYRKLLAAEVGFRIALDESTRSCDQS